MLPWDPLEFLRAPGERTGGDRDRRSSAVGMAILLGRSERGSTVSGKNF